MQEELLRLYRATNPTKTLRADNETDRKMYVDFAAVRGARIVEEIKDNITFLSAGMPSCDLFTGHVGCGKSTELWRLKQELEAMGYHVVYFESSQELELDDVDVSDILLEIARQVSESLQQFDRVNLPAPSRFAGLMEGIVGLFKNMEISGELSLWIAKIKKDSNGLTLMSEGIGKVTMASKNSPDLRHKLREYLGSRTRSVLEIVNNELLEPARELLKAHDKAGLVVIVDNLDRVDGSHKSWGRPLPEYLFVDRADQLRQLHCHVLYVIPLALMFSKDYDKLVNRFGLDPKVLPMIPPFHRDGSLLPEGMALLRKLVLARAFPDTAEEDRVSIQNRVFESEEAFTRLLSVSGGHVRGLLKLLNSWISKERALPLTLARLEQLIQSQSDQLAFSVEEKQWDLLKRVYDTKKISGDEGYQNLLQQSFIYRYTDDSGIWFDVNPLLRETGRF